MKICAACHTDLPKDSYSKKQWKLDKYQRRCKVCTFDNREVQSIPKQDNNDQNTKEVVKSLDSICLVDTTELKISDEELFKQPPPYDDCPICFLTMPSLDSAYKYYTCCGKEVCSGCIHANGIGVDSNCPFCRAPMEMTKEGTVSELTKRMKAGDAMAFHTYGCFYSERIYGYPKDYTKALELWHRAGELGCTKAYNNIGNTYLYGRGVEVDEKKATYYYGLSAMAGDAGARYNLGLDEIDADNFDRAVKHFMIAARSGCSDSLKYIKDLYSNGYATKEDYKRSLQSFQEHLGEIKSPQRDEAAKAYFGEACRYY